MSWLSVQPIALLFTKAPIQFCAFFGFFLLQVFPQGGVNELTKNLSLKRSDAVTDENQDFQIVVNALFFNTLVGVPVRMGYIIFP
jgi:hypothetical protein